VLSVCAQQVGVVWGQLLGSFWAASGQLIGSFWVASEHNLPTTSRQVYCVLSAIRERRKTFTFTDGSVTSLDPRVGFFITMNPGCGTGSRVEAAWKLLHDTHTRAHTHTHARGTRMHAHVHARVCGLVLDPSTVP
jgi:hypothetical protein